MNEGITYGQTSRGFEVTYEGRTVIIGRPSVAELREHIAAETVRMAEAERRMRLNVALADAMEADELAAAEVARLQRNAKSARTRAHNVDPFGFKAMEVAR